MLTGGAVPVPAPAPGDRNSPNPLETWVRCWVPMKHPVLWWMVGFVGAVVGVTFFRLSSNFNDLLGDPKPLQNIVYALLWVFIFVLAVMLHHLKLPREVLPFRRQLEAFGVVVALFLIFIYTFLSRKGEEQHNKTPNNNLPGAGIVSFVGFAFMSFALSIQTDYGFIEELTKFFLEELMVELTKKKWWLGFLGALFSFVFIIIGSCKEKPPENSNASGDLDQAPTSNNTAPSGDIEMANILTPSPSQEHPLTRALRNLNEMDLELARDLRRCLIGYINDWTDDIKDTVMKGHNFIKDRIPQQVVAALAEEMANRMTSSNDPTENWLVMEYIRSRERFFLKCKSVLKPDRSEAQNLTTIKKWIKHCNIALKILIPNERILCQQIFGESSPILEKCFEHFCFQVVKKDFLSFIQRIPELTSSPEVSQVFRTVQDLIVPEFKSLFPLNRTMLAEMTSLERKVGKAIRDHYFPDDDFPQDIEIFYSCEVHPTTMKVMHRLGTAYKDRESIETILQANPKTNVKVWMGRFLISNYIEWSIEKLEDYLEAKFKSTYDDELQGVSMMANVSYILKKAYEFGFELTKEEGWVQKQAWKIQRCRDKYWANRTELLAFLKHHNVNATEDSMMKMLRSFGLNIFLEQNSYGYRGELQLYVFDGFVPNCETFLTEFRALLNGNRESGRHTDIISAEDEEIEDDQMTLLRARHRTR